MARKTPKLVHFDIEHLEKIQRIASKKRISENAVVRKAVEQLR